MARRLWDFSPFVMVLYVRTKLVFGNQEQRGRHSLYQLPHHFPPFYPKVVGSGPLDATQGNDERWRGAEPEEEKEYYLFLPKHMESSYLKLTSSFSFLKNFRKYLLLWNVLLLLSHVYLYIWDLNTMICSIFHMTALDKWSQDHPCHFLLKIKHASPSLPCPDLFVCLLLLVCLLLFN